MAEMKTRGFLSKIGFKSKEDKLAEAAAQKAAQEQRVDEQMAARMAAINAAALKSAREQDQQSTRISDEDTARIEAAEQRQAAIQAAKDVARAKQLAEEKQRRDAAAVHSAEAEAAQEAERKAKAAQKALDDAAFKARQEQDARDAKLKAQADQDAEDARIKAAHIAALAKAKSDADAKVLKDTQAAEAQAREQARVKAEAKRIADETAQAEKAQAEREAALKAEAEQHAAREEAARAKAEAKRLSREALEAERRAKIAEEQAARDMAAKDLAAKNLAAKDLAARNLAASPQNINKSDTPDPAPVTDESSDTLAAGNFLSRITEGLRKSTTRMGDQVSAVFTKRKLDDAAIEELEDILIASDLGVGPAAKVIAHLSADKFDKQVTDMEVKIALADVISEIMTPLEKPILLGIAKPQILLFVGVNGSGKTTTLGKIAKRYADEGKKVLIAAGDTFRAAAVEQITVWGERSGAPVMSAKPGADAAGLIYDAITRARDENFDILMIDTAGRLQNRTELMDELSKIIRVIQKQDPSAPHHSILVLDATVGQNALMQTEAFKETAGVTGLIMTKMDGTAKGGVLVALSDKYSLPIHYIGIGERIEDLENFSAPVFAAALSGVSDAMTKSS